MDAGSFCLMWFLLIINYSIESNPASLEAICGAALESQIWENTNKAAGLALFVGLVCRPTLQNGRGFVALRTSAANMASAAAFHSTPPASSTGAIVPATPPHISLGTPGLSATTAITGASAIARPGSSAPSRGRPRHHCVHAAALGSRPARCHPLTTATKAPEVPVDNAETGAHTRPEVGAVKKRLDADARLVVC